MSDKINAGVVVMTKFVASSSSVFTGYIDYIDRENAVRNEHISSFSVYTDYMDNPTKTSDLFTDSSNHLSAEEKTSLKRVYETAQKNGSPMWQTVISFDNRWLEEHGLYDSKTKILDTKHLMGYTRKAVNPMLEAEGLENATWSAAIHYNTDNLHIHIATVEPIPTRKKEYKATLKLSAKWVKDNNILFGGYRTGEYISSYAKNTNYDEKQIFNRLKIATKNDFVFEKGFIVNKDSSINVVTKHKYKSLPKYVRVISAGEDYRGKFKLSSIDKCKSRMVNQIIEQSPNNQQLNEVMRNSLVASMKGNALFEDREIVQKFLYVYNQLPPQKNEWKYGMNKIAHLRPQLDEITKMFFNKYKSDEFAQFQSIIDKQGQDYKEAYGGDADTKRIKSKTNELFKRCGNVILSQMKAMSFKDLRELESSSYISAEVEEAAVNNAELNFDGRINYKGGKNKSGKADQNKSKYWTEEFKSARYDLSEALKIEDEGEKALVLNKILEIYKDEIDNGNDVAAYELGRCYKLGTFGEIELEHSQQCYQKAFEGFTNELDNVKGKDEWLTNYLNYRIGRMLVEGEGTDRNVDEGISYLEQSNSTFAYFVLGNLYYGKGALQDYEKAYEYFSLAGFPDDGVSMPFALYNMAEMLDKNLIIDENLNKDTLYNKALSLFVSSEEENPNDLIEYKIASMMLSGKGCEVDKDTAEEYLIKSSEYGNTFAQTKLAKLYIESGASDNLKQAINLLQKAASSGNDIAQYQLGKIYYNEEYGLKDIYKALLHFTNSAEQGNQFAQYQLGLIYYKGDDVEQDVELAMKYLNLSAEQNNQFAQYTLGIIHLKGDIVNADINKAVRYFELSANHNNQFAQYQLGKIYYFGANGIEVDKGKAIDYLTKSAAQGNEFAKALLEWQPTSGFGFYNNKLQFSESLISLSSDMRQLFERLANEHDHMLNQMIYNRIEREKQENEL